MEPLDNSRKMSLNTGGYKLWQNRHMPHLGYNAYYLRSMLTHQNCLILQLPKIIHHYYDMYSGMFHACVLTEFKTTGGCKMKKVLSTIVAAIVAVAFAGVVFAAEPATPATPATPAADVKKEEKAPVKKTKKTKKAKKAKKTMKKEEAPAATPATPAEPAAK